MTARDLSHSDFAGLEQSHAQRLAVAKFAKMDEGWHECSPIEDFALTAFTFLLGITPVLVVLYFALS